MSADAPTAALPPTDHDAAWPRLGPEEEAAVLDVLRSGDLSLHGVTRELEADYAARCGRRWALGHANGTAALLAAFWALDLEPGSEVLVPSATHWASAVPMLWAGLVPVFCESEPERLGLNPADAARRVTPRTRALVYTHLWGVPADVAGLRALARERGLLTIEDASHAHGATWRGRPCGALADLSVFSLQTGKLAPAGEGGVLLGDDPALHERAVLLGDVMRILELDGPGRRFGGTSFGVKTRLAPLSAAVARAQLRRLDAFNADCRRDLGPFAARLAELGLETCADSERVYFELLARCDPARTGRTADELVAALRERGCQVARPRYPLLHQAPLFVEGAYRRVLRAETAIDYAAVALPGVERLQAELVRFPRLVGADPGTKALRTAYLDAVADVLG